MSINGILGGSEGLALKRFIYAMYIGMLEGKNSEEVSPSYLKRFLDDVEALVKRWLHPLKLSDIEKAHLQKEFLEYAKSFAKNFVINQGALHLVKLIEGTNEEEVYQCAKRAAELYWGKWLELEGIWGYLKPEEKTTLKRVFGEYLSERVENDLKKLVEIQLSIDWELCPAELAKTLKDVISEKAKEAIAIKIESDIRQGELTPFPTVPAIRSKELEEILEECRWIRKKESIFAALALSFNLEQYIREVLSRIALENAIAVLKNALRKRKVTPLPGFLRVPMLRAVLKRAVAVISDKVECECPDVRHAPEKAELALEELRKEVKALSKRYAKKIAPQLPFQYAKGLPARRNSFY